MDGQYTLAAQQSQDAIMDIPGDVMNTVLGSMTPYIEQILDNRLNRGAHIRYIVLLLVRNTPHYGLGDLIDAIPSLQIPMKVNDSHNDFILFPSRLTFSAIPLSWRFP